MDALAYDMEERVYLLLARQQPMAIDLRTLVTIVRVVHELERIGDLMGNVAKAARRLYPRQLDPRLRGLIDRMREQATAQLQVATDAFAERDPVRARALADMDDVMDDLQKELFRTIFSFPARDEAAVQLAVQVAPRRPLLRAHRRPRGQCGRAGGLHGHRLLPAPAPADAVLS